MYELEDLEFDYQESHGDCMHGQVTLYMFSSSLININGCLQ